MNCVEKREPYKHASVYYFTSRNVSEIVTDVSESVSTGEKLLGLKRILTDYIARNLEILLYSKLDIFCLNKRFLNNHIFHGYKTLPDTQTTFFFSLSPCTC